jgi:hypothetical protein
MVRRINKNDISSPKPFLGTDRINTVEAARPKKNPLIPFAVGRHDVSVSVVGGPQDPRTYEPNVLKTLSYRQFQTFVQALCSYKKQIQTLAMVTETLVQQLQEMADCVPQANIKEPYLIADLDFMIDSSQLMANAYLTWAINLEKDVEESLLNTLESLPAKAVVTKEENKQKIKHLIHSLHLEEEKSLKVKELNKVQTSLNKRMQMADEIKRLNNENEQVLNELSQGNIPLLLKNVSKLVEVKLEAFETIQEGFHKVKLRFNFRLE